jgi:hypothetical protein
MTGTEGATVSTTSNQATTSSENTSGGDASLTNKIEQSTAQTMQLQTAMMAHNLAVGPLFAAKSTSDDLKKV